MSEHTPEQIAATLTQPQWKALRCVVRGVHWGYSTQSALALARKGVLEASETYETALYHWHEGKRVLQWEAKPGEILKPRYQFFTTELARVIALRHDPEPAYRAVDPRVKLI